MNLIQQFFKQKEVGKKPYTTILLCHYDNER